MNEEIDPDIKAEITQQQQIYIDAIITQSILLVLYFGTLVHLYRKARLSLVGLLAGLFMVSCVTWIVENKLKLMYFY